MTAAQLEGHRLLLDSDWERGEDDPPIAYGRPTRTPAGPWPLILPYHTPVRPWVAEITGYSETYRYARTFLKAERTPKDRVYSLQPGRTYEVSDGEGERYFILAPRFDDEVPITLLPNDMEIIFRE